MRVKRRFILFHRDTRKQASSQWWAWTSQYHPHWHAHPKQMENSFSVKWCKLTPTSMKTPPPPGPPSWMESCSAPPSEQQRHSAHNECNTSLCNTGGLCNSWIVEVFVFISPRHLIYPFKWSQLEPFSTLLFYSPFFPWRSQMCTYYGNKEVLFLLLAVAFTLLIISARGWESHFNEGRFHSFVDMTLDKRRNTESLCGTRTVAILWRNCANNRSESLEYFCRFLMKRCGCYANKWDKLPAEIEPSENVDTLNTREWHSLTFSSFLLASS